MNIDKPNFLNPAITNGKMSHIKNHRKWYFALTHFVYGYETAEEMIEDRKKDREIYEKQKNCENNV